MGPVAKAMLRMRPIVQKIARQPFAMGLARGYALPPAMRSVFSAMRNSTMRSSIITRM